MIEAPLSSVGTVCGSQVLLPSPRSFLTPVTRFGQPPGPFMLTHPLFCYNFGCFRRFPLPMTAFFSSLPRILRTCDYIMALLWPTSSLIPLRPGLLLSVPPSFFFFPQILSVLCPPPSLEECFDGALTVAERFRIFFFRHGSLPICRNIKWFPLADRFLRKSSAWQFSAL